MDVSSSLALVLEDLERSCIAASIAELAVDGGYTVERDHGTERRENLRLQHYRVRSAASCDVHHAAGALGYVVVPAVEEGHQSSRCDEKLATNTRLGCKMKAEEVVRRHVIDHVKKVHRAAAASTTTSSSAGG